MRNKFQQYNIYVIILLIISLGCKKESSHQTATVSSFEIIAVSDNTIQGNIDIKSDGGTAVISRGVCWNVNQNPTVSDYKTVDGTGIGRFTSAINGLLPGVTYYIRSYAVNSIGIAYGDQITVTTLSTVPVIETSPLTDITATTLTAGGVVSNDGGSPILARGVCWSSDHDPSLDFVDKRTNDGTTTGSFISRVTGLKPGTLFRFRAYATNKNGIAYGNLLTTVTPAILPSLTTNTVLHITEATAVSGGNILNNGGASIINRGVCWSTTSNPTINDNRSSDGTELGSFISNLNGLPPSKMWLHSNTTYYVRAYATNSVGTGYGNEVSFTTKPGSNATITDIDGNVYHMITIGTQVWFLENLKVTHYRNGDPIPNISDNDGWNKTTTGAYCWYNNDISYKNTYGALYNYYITIDPRNLCPPGSHIPTDAEWMTLINYSGGTSFAADKLKEAGVTHWIDQITETNNLTGFTALPGGERDRVGTFLVLGGWGNYFSKSYLDQFSHNAGWTFGWGDKGLTLNVFMNLDGISVRCIKD